MYSTLTFSKAELAAKCIGSVVLDSAPTEVGEAARTGTEIHSYLRAVADEVEKAQGEMSPEVYSRALARVPPEYQEACSRIPLDKIPVDPEAFTPEVAFAYDVESDMARELGRDIGRHYPELLETEIAGTADLAGIDQGCAVVVDFKTGRFPPKARDCLQIHGYALCLARIYKLDQARVAILHIPAYDPDKEPRWDEYELDTIALDTIACELQDLHHEIGHWRQEWGEKQKTPPLVQGGHCRYCPAFSMCPAKMSLIQTWADTHAKLSERELTSANVRELALWLGNAEDVLEALRKTINEWAGEHPFEMPDGKLYGPHRWVKTSLGDPTPVIQERLGAEAVQAVQAVVERSCSKEALKRAIRPFVEARGLKITQSIDEIVAEMKARGLAAVKESWPVGPYLPREEK